MKLSTGFMKGLRRRTLIAALSFAAQVGCSNVGFQPTPEALQAASLNDPNLKSQDFVFDQARPKAKVDVMFVVDNSGSMFDEQQKLAGRLNSFINSLGRVDWQIGVTTTDVSSGRFGLQGSLANISGTNSKVLTPSTPNFLSLYAQTITDNGTPRSCVPGMETPETCASPDEQPLRAISMAIAKRNQENAGFFRPDADLATIILSDEDELSDGKPITDATGATTIPTSPDSILADIRSAFGANKRLTSFGIIVQPGDTTCYQSQGFNRTDGPYGTFASALASMTGGLTGSICDSDYGPALASIGQRVVRRAVELKLRETVKPESVRVQIIPFDSNITWEFNNGAVQLNDQPQQGTIVRVYYLPEKASNRGP